MARSLLSRELVQTPALVVALLDNFPSQRKFLRSHLALFLDDFVGKPSPAPSSENAGEELDVASPIVNPVGLPPRTLSLANGIEPMNGAYKSFRVQTPLNKQLKRNNMKPTCLKTYLFFFVCVCVVAIVDQYVSTVERHDNELLPVMIASIFTDLSSGSSTLREENVSAGTPTASTPSQVAAGLAASVDAAHLIKGDIVAEVNAILERGASRFRTTKTPVETPEDRARFETLVLDASSEVLPELLSFLKLKNLGEFGKRQLEISS